MKLEPEDVAAATRRLKRARGQLDAVIRMLEEGVDCEEIVPQITAAATAVRGTLSSPSDLLTNA